MSLTLNATPGDPAANAYATVAAAVTLATYRVGGAAFLALTPDQQIQALVTATRDIDSIEGFSPGFIGGFIGARASATQALEWPRSGTLYPSNALPPNLVNATIELALTYTPLFATGATGDPLNQDPNYGNLKREKVDVIETEYFAPMFMAPTTTPATALQRFPTVVQRLLIALVIVAPSVWRAGSAVVTRGS